MFVWEKSLNRVFVVIVFFASQDLWFIAGSTNWLKMHSSKTGVWVFFPHRSPSFLYFPTLPHLISLLVCTVSFECVVFVFVVVLYSHAIEEVSPVVLSNELVCWINNNVHLNRSPGCRQSLQLRLLLRNKKTEKNL